MSDISTVLGSLADICKKYPPEVIDAMLKNPVAAYDLKQRLNKEEVRRLRDEDLAGLENSSLRLSPTNNTLFVARVRNDRKNFLFFGHGSSLMIGECAVAAHNDAGYVAWAETSEDSRNIDVYVLHPDRVYTQHLVIPRECQCWMHDIPYGIALDDEGRVFVLVYHGSGELSLSETWWGIWRMPTLDEGTFRMVLECKLEGVLKVDSFEVHDGKLLYRTCDTEARLRQIVFGGQVFVDDVQLSRPYYDRTTQRVYYALEERDHVSYIMHGVTQQQDYSNLGRAKKPFDIDQFFFYEGNFVEVTTDHRVRVNHITISEAYDHVFSPRVSDNGRLVFGARTGKRLYRVEYPLR